MKMNGQFNYGSYAIFYFNFVSLEHMNHRLLITSPWVYVTVLWPLTTSISCITVHTNFETMLVQSIMVLTKRVTLAW